MKIPGVLRALVVAIVGVLIFSALLGVFGLDTAIAALVLTWAFVIFSVYRLGGRHAS
jgi:hypothetical protein